MASIFRFVPPAFRTRSPIRDAATDLRRLESLRTGVLDALDSATREYEGLKQRLEGYQMRAASLMDNAPSFGERSAREEAELSRAEGQVLAATERLRQLREHIAHLGQVLGSVEIEEPTEQRLGA